MELKYPLNQAEQDILEEVWDFINIFSKQYVFISDYRKYIINTIRNKYTPEQFLLYESIANKLFWNLRWLLYPLWLDEDITETKYTEIIKNNYGGLKELPHILLLCKSTKFYDEKHLHELVRNVLLSTTYYRSFVNKIVIIDRKNSIVHTKPFEGSSDIFSKNYFNLLTMSILFDRKLYEATMRNPYEIKNKNIELSQFYYQYDYGFPNLNYCTYDFGTQDQKLDRIKKMYYNNIDKKSRYWFKLLE
jgi:hypothetical protein